MNKAIQCIEKCKNSFKFIDEEGEIIYTNLPAIKELIEVAYLEGQLDALEDCTIGTPIDASKETLDIELKLIKLTN